MARASYQSTPKIHLGKPKTLALSSSERAALLEVRHLIDNALQANSTGFCNVNLSTAYRSIRSILSNRIK